MKITASLGVASLLCLLVMVRVASAQATWTCVTSEGCPFELCYIAAGACPGGMPLYTYAKNITRTAWGCSPTTGPGCSATVESPFCTVTGYGGINMGVCTGEVCTYNESVNMCS
jgi:hypothetical protein